VHPVLYNIHGIWGGGGGCRHNYWVLSEEMGERYNDVKGNNLGVLVLIQFKWKRENLAGVYSNRKRTVDVRTMGISARRANGGDWRRSEQRRRDFALEWKFWHIETCTYSLRHSIRVSCAVRLFITVATARHTVRNKSSGMAYHRHGVKFRTDQRYLIQFLCALSAV
jgi:hypothetical protein